MSLGGKCKVCKAARMHKSVPLFCSAGGWVVNTQVRYRSQTRATRVLGKLRSMLLFSSSIISILGDDRIQAGWLELLFLV